MSVRIERRGDVVVLVGECHDKPCAVVEAEGLCVQSKHSSEKCSNLISWEQIERARRDYLKRFNQVANR